MTPLSIHNWPRAIAHIDADAFFASVEQAVHPSLKGKPVATGAERGIVAAASYEAKKKGIKRGMPLYEVKRVCPECIHVSSDYEIYSLFSKKMFEIIRRFTPELEEYSIDEGFTDLTGLRRLYRTSYKEIGKLIQTTISKELDISVSIGISLSKSLAKLCSKYEKPGGLTVVPGKLLDKFLSRIPIGEIWGFGPNTKALLKKYNIKTAENFAKKPTHFVKKLLGKTGHEIWLELNGHYINKISTEEKKSYASISKTKTFTPPSSEPNFLMAQLIRNLESACIKARRYNLAPKRIQIFLKRSDFLYDWYEATLTCSTVSPVELTKVVKELFIKTIKPGKQYRATGVVLLKLQNISASQLPLFSDAVKIIKMEKLNSAIDSINQRFGKHTLFISNGLYLGKRQHKGKRGKSAWRKNSLLKGETRQRHLKIPLLDMNKKHRFSK